jgi:YD repeat-containing protein
MMMTRASILAILAVLAYAPAHAQSAAEREIAAVRTVYQAVTRAAAAGELVRRDSTVRCSPDDLGQEVKLWRDARGTIRQLTWEGGTDDHAETLRFYYDGDGRLRFVFATRGAVNGTRQEERVYYAADGRLLRRRATRLAGPGYPFGEVEPIWRPAAWLRRLCTDDRGE